MPARRLIALLSLCILVLAACSGGGEGVEGEGLAEEEATTGAAGGTEAAGGGGEAPEAGTLVVALSSQPDQLDPHRTTAGVAFDVLENVYDTLVVPDPETLEMVPSLASEWTVSDDELTWTFTLQEGVTFHDGSEFDSADVAYSFNRIINQDLANAFRFATVESIETPDPQTVVINLSEPTPNLLANIGGFKGMAIIPEGYAGSVDAAAEGESGASPSPQATEDGAANLSTEAVGTGPFQLESVSPDGITLTAYEDYWGEGPLVDGVEFRFISEPTTALTELQTGTVHWTDNIPPQQIESLRETEDVVLESIPSTDYWYWTANFEREPFGDQNVRDALAYAIDREAITEAAMFGAATVNQTAIPPDSFWASDYAPYSYDPERARELLDEAGVENLEMGLMVTNEFPETVTVAEVIASQLAEVGITVNIEQETFATWLDRNAQGDFDAFMLGWLGNLDPFGYYHSQHVCGGSNNAQNYCNEEVTQLLEEAAVETDREQRRDLYHQAVEQIVDDGSYWYLYNPDVVEAWVPELSGYVIRPDGALNLETVQLEG